MTKYKVVVLDNLLPLTGIELNAFAAIDASIEQYDLATPAEIIKAAGDADAVMVTGAQVTREVINGLKKCKVIGRYGIGLNNIDLDAATDNGIVVTYAPVYCQDEVATMALCLMLACERRLIQADKVVKSGNWKGALSAVRDARSTQSKTFGLVGFGSIARKVVPLIKPLGVKIIAYDPYIDLDVCKELDVEAVELDYLLKNSDYISLHAPLMQSTYHMIGAEQFNVMKRNAILINTGRGGLVDQREMFKALKEGKIAAAGLDVLEDEPPDPNDPIFTLDNVITSGHIGAATIESIERLRKIVLQGVVDVLTGFWPQYPGNPAVKEKLSLK